MADGAKLELILAAKDLASKEVGKLHSALDKLHGAAGKTGGGLKAAGGGIATMGKVAGVAALGGFALLTSQIILGSKALADQSKIDAQTAAVIKSTGSAAHVTAQHVDDLANAIKDYSGVDDDAIKKGENMLLTFTNIRNGVGKNKQVFDDATKTLIDMSVAMGGDAQKTAIQLGKALNDPIKGITALTKVGVTFTDQQKKQIAAMVKAGDTAGAQKVILAELSREFGGSAKAAGDSAAGGWNKFQNAVQDLQKQLGAYFLPILVTVLGFLTKTVLPAVSGVIDGIGGWVKANQPLIHQIGAFVSGAMSALFGIIGKVAGAIGGGKGGGLIATVVDMAKTVISFVVPKVHALFKTLGDVATSVGKVVGPIIKALLPAFGNVVKALFGGGKGKGLIPAIGDLIGVLWGDGHGALANVVKIAGGAFGILFDALSTAIGWLGDLIDKIREAIAWLQKLAAQLDKGAKNRKVFAPTGGTGGGISGPEHRAGGGPLWPGRWTLGENRPEDVVVSRGGGVYVESSARSSSGGSPNPSYELVAVGKRDLARMVDEQLYFTLRRAAPSGGRV